MGLMSDNGALYASDLVKVQESVTEQITIQPFSQTEFWVQATYIPGYKILGTTQLYLEGAVCPVFVSPTSDSDWFNGWISNTADYQITVKARVGFLYLKA